MQKLNWRLSWRADPLAREIADRHYNRQSIGSPQFVPPGRCVVLLERKARALWVTSWPFAEFVKHDWPGAWVCSCFRNESGILSSSLIREAVAATRAVYAAEFVHPPSLGMVTFVNAEKVRPKSDPVRCFIAAGFEVVGETKAGLIALQMKPSAMPLPVAALPQIRQVTIKA